MWKYLLSLLLVAGVASYAGYDVGQSQYQKKLRGQVNPQTSILVTVDGVGRGILVVYPLRDTVFIPRGKITEGALPGIKAMVNSSTFTPLILQLHCIPDMTVQFKPR